MRACEHIINDALNETSGYYSTVAGVMAGFAFVSLFHLVTAEDGEGGEDGQRFQPAAQALGVAFVCLLLTAITYAVLAGETATGGRAATMEVVAGVGFAVAANHLIYAIVRLIDAHRKTMPLKRFFQNIGAAVVCPLSFLLLQLGMSDYLTVRRGAAGALVERVGWGLLALTVVGCGVACWRGERIKKLRVRLDPSYCALAIGAGSVVGASVCGVSLNACSSASGLVMVAVQLVACGVLVNQAWWMYAPSRAAGLPRSGARDRAETDQAMMTAGRADP